MSSAASSPPSSSWSPSSWRGKPIKQQPPYADQAEVDAACAKITALPGLVSKAETDALRAQLAEVAAGKRFLLQGGDCAERFEDCTTAAIQAKLKILLQMSLVLMHQTRCPVVRVGRMAGQFAKPRSNDMETLPDGRRVFSFRGDNCNEYDRERRTPDPDRLVQGYFVSGVMLNHARSLLASGFANLRDASDWELGHTFQSSSGSEKSLDPALRKKYEAVVGNVLDSIDFMELCGATTEGSTDKVDLFTSHEGLTLCLEEACTENVGGQWYNNSAHFLWIGDRTRQLDHAHVEYFRGIANPIGVKVGPTSKPDELVALIKCLWPEPAASPGKITLITRFGNGNVEEMLPPLLKAVQAAKLPVVWQCDPMHGNTRNSKPDGKFKTREFDAILGEITSCFKVHTAHGSWLGGIHFELTGENVTECVGGPQNLQDADLQLRYETYCDPRLNSLQSLAMAFSTVELINDAIEAAKPEVDLGTECDYGGSRL